jgi:hypothetical protein
MMILILLLGFVVKHRQEIALPRHGYHPRWDQDPWVSVEGKINADDDRVNYLICFECIGKVVSS